MRTALAAVLVTAFTLTGCASNQDDPPAEDTATQSPTEEPSEEPSEEPEPQATTVAVEIEGDKVTPNGKRVEVAVGEPVVLEITSDRATELHVHSSPEQVLDVDEGDSTLELTIDRPGVVDVEEHESGVVILQLEVS